MPRNAYNHPKRQRADYFPSTQPTPDASAPPVSYDNPLQDTNPAMPKQPEEYEKQFISNYRKLIGSSEFCAYLSAALDLVYKLKSLKALQLALENELITPEQFQAKQAAFVNGFAF